MERLQKVMAHAGVASRRKSEELIRQGRVSVNGETITEMGHLVGKDDIIMVDQELIEKEDKVYILLNKPRQVISTASDPHDRETVIDYIDGLDERVYPVGRLDYDTTGVLILTNDGELANRLMHPSYHVQKTYLAKVTGKVSAEDIHHLEAGVNIDGKKTAPAQAKVVSFDKKTDTSMVELTIHEGRNHQVKKMMEATGHLVDKLTRIRYGFLTTDNLQSGEWRYLTREEVAKFKRLVKL